MMKRMLMITSAIGLCLAAPAFAQNANTQDPQNVPRTERRNDAKPDQNSGTQGAPRMNNQSQSAGGNQQPASGSSSTNAQAPASSGPSQSATDNKNPDRNGRAQNQQSSPNANSTAQAPASNQPQSGSNKNQDQKGQAQNRQTDDTKRSTNNAQAPAQNDRSASDRNPSNRNGQAQNRDNQRDNRRDAQRDNRQNSRNADTGNKNADRTSAALKVNINDNQRTRIAATIRTSNVRPVNVNFRIATGIVVPRTVTLHTLPSSIIEVVPQYRGYRYFVTREQIVIVEPSRQTIVAVMPADGAAAQASAPSDSRVRFTDQQRDVIRQRTSSTRSIETTGASTYMVEEEVPATIELQEFPTEIYTEMPEVRTYRYFRRDNDVIVVDPTQRRVIEVIR
jgi:hypothetical protein